MALVLTETFLAGNFFLKITVSQFDNL